MDSYKVRFIPIGGIVDVTKNMYLYELYTNGVLSDILVVDCGIGFPKEKELGVDYVIPDITYLLDKKDKIRAIVLTHGHEDHISALKFHYEALGKPPVYAAKLTSLLVQEKFAEAGLTLKVNQISFRKDYNFGPYTVRFITMTHSIPDCMHVLIKTPVGAFYHGQDFKLDLTPPYSEPPDFYEITKAGEDGVICLFSDCLGSEEEGLTLSESIVGKTFEDEIRTTKGKFIMTTFSSNISRIRQCAEAAVKFNRSICFMGRSMKQNVLLTKDIGYLPIPPRFLVDERKVMDLPPNKVCIIAAGSQGQYDSALSKIANNMNKFIQILPGDKVLFSSDPIPGQEDDVYDLIERLSMLQATVVYSDVTARLHASGHGNQEDLKFLMRFVKAKHLIPIGGTVRHQQRYLDIARQLGYKDNQVHLLKEGETFEFERGGNGTKGETIETKNVFVDAYGIGDVGSMILRDRKTLSTEGIVVALLSVDRNFGLIKKPEFITRGFLFGENQESVFTDASAAVMKVLAPREGKIQTEHGLKMETNRVLEQLFATKTGRKPLVVVEVLSM